ncbi:MAG: permease [Phycisphaerae bacterium]|nr:permease [Phycisphaerae bacterium]
MNWKKEWKILVLIVVVFAGCYYLPVGNARFDNAVSESFELVKDYARAHVLFCLVPAFFIAGAIGVFVSQGAVMKYLGPKANKAVAYGVASVSGTILAVCSCTVLPLFAGIYRMGAGLGPATAFLYSGPAINVLSIILTARVLGIELGLARAIGAIVFSVVIGLLMHLIYRKEELNRPEIKMVPGSEEEARPLYQMAIYFAMMVGVLVFANWAKPAESSGQEGLWAAIYSVKWIITAVFATGLLAVLGFWFKMSWWKLFIAQFPVWVLAVIFPSMPILAFTAGIIGLSIVTSTDKGEGGQWFFSSWTFAKQILPLLFFGVLVAGFLLGRPDYEGIIPKEWVNSAVGGNSLKSNLFASIAGAFMYFATLTEVPILQGLIGAGMGKGPALSLLLAGPALSLPNMLVIRSVMGTQKTIVYVALVIVMATISGIIFGTFFY